jgi:hypothetical protein
MPFMHISRRLSGNQTQPFTMKVQACCAWPTCAARGRMAFALRIDPAQPLGADPVCPSCRRPLRLLSAVREVPDLGTQSPTKRARGICPCTRETPCTPRR